MAHACILFEDPFVDRLRPINLARPTCQITVGAYSLDELAADLGLPIHWHVRPHLRGIAARQGRGLAAPLAGPLLYLNAALVPELAILERLRELLAAGKPFVAVNDQRVTAALCPADFPLEQVEKPAFDVAAYLLDRRLGIVDDEFATLDFTFDVVSRHERLLPSHLDHQIRRKKLRTIGEHVYVGKNCDIASNVVFDTDDGPIVIGDMVRVRPFSYLSGPVKIGDHCLVIDHSSLKHGTVLGNTVKAGGEVESTIIEPYSNKQHHGFLGHSYVGSWVNLGAGTSNSDLKNTYGDIDIEVDGEKIRTSCQFLGCIIGDYSKTAINTSIFTGKLIGVASFLYGFVSTNVPSFTNYARSFGQVTEVAVDVAIKTQLRAARRRQVELTEVDHRLLQDLFDLTRAERQLSSEQVVL